MTGCKLQRLLTCSFLSEGPGGSLGAYPVVAGSAPKVREVSMASAASCLLPSCFVPTMTVLGA